jgi:hypothetical protein
MDTLLILSAILIAIVVGHILDEYSHYSRKD